MSAVDYAASFIPLGFVAMLIRTRAHSQQHPLGLASLVPLIVGFYLGDFTQRLRGPSR